MRHEGDLRITAANAASFAGLEHVSGDLIIMEKVVRSFDRLDRRRLDAEAWIKELGDRIALRADRLNVSADFLIQIAEHRIARDRRAGLRMAA